MKLRNKKTGKIGELHYNPEKEYCFTIATEDPADMMIYKTIGGIWYDWEDYIPEEPLIKDEKIRKAVRAWAEATRTTSVDIQGNELESRQNDSWIIFDGEIVGLVADAGDNYTIAELCGEEEKC